jgi:hypothetical protein
VLFKDGPHFVDEIHRRGKSGSAQKGKKEAHEGVSDTGFQL